jgi:hypothetical protein
MRLKELYLYIGFATMVASMVMSAYTILVAPFFGYKMLIDTNHYGEGLIEAVLIILTAPVWFFLLRRMLDDLVRPGDDASLAPSVRPKTFAAARARAAKVARK